jgi:integrase
MKNRYRLICRGCRDGMYYCVDTKTGKRTSLRTRDKAEADELVQAKNHALRHCELNLQLARAYLSVGDRAMETRTWQQVMEAMLQLKRGETYARWLTVIKDKAFEAIRHRIVWETRSEEFLNVLGEGSVSTNVYLWRIQNFALDMNWLPWPVIPNRQWPRVEHGKKRAIMLEEHKRIIERERNAERKAFYELAWYLGASQSDFAYLHAENIDWTNKVIAFERRKLRGRQVEQIAQISFSVKVGKILRQRPSTGPLFPNLMRVRASEFKQRCKGLKIDGVTLHSYRYAWAERAKVAGYPERFAQVALRHNSKTVHRAYAQKALVTIPPLEEFEKRRNDANGVR